MISRRSGPRTTAQRALRTHAAQNHGIAKRETFAVVAIGASAGGLEAFRALLAALPARSGMSFILVQHLDPIHTSMLVDLLSPYTVMTILEARDEMRPEPDRIHIIPPGRFLSVIDGTLRLSYPRDGQGVRMPFDFLLHSLAAAFGERAVSIVLSGTGNPTSRRSSTARRR